MTLRYYPDYESMDPVCRKKVAKLFGSLKVKYTPKYVHSTLGDWGNRERYEVLGQDGNSVVIKSVPNEMKTGIDKANAEFASELLGDDSPYVSRIYHIHFREIRKREYYWISSNLPFGRPVFVEWFKRI